MRLSADRVTGWLRAHGLDLAAIVALLAGFFVVNDVRHWISAPYWLDESWVALSTRVPITELPRITSTTPIGWSLLLRAVPDPDALRLVPLIFALATVPAAYLFGRLLPWRNRLEAVVAGGLAASAVVLLPAAQQRHDLKQYTADAACAIGLLALTVWAERTGRRRDLVVLAAAAPVAFLFSSVATAVAAAAFGGLVVAAALRRDRALVVERLVTSAASGLALVALYLALVVPVRNPSLQGFWREFYPAAGDLPAYLDGRLSAEAPSLGMGPWWVWLLLFLGGVVAVATLHARGTAAAVLLLPAVLVVLGLLKAYPLLEGRTSYFLFAVAAAVIGVGFARLAGELARTARRPSIEPALTVALALALVAGYAIGNRPSYRLENPGAIYYSDVRTQTEWVDAHRLPGDVVLMSLNARYGYLFYRDDQPLRWHTSTAFAHGWDAEMPADPDLVIAGILPDEIHEAVEAAVARARSNGPQARVLVVRTFWQWAGGWEAWQDALAPYELTYPYDSVEPVTVIEHP